MRNLTAREGLAIALALSFLPPPVFAEILHIGSVHSRPVEEIKKLMPLATYLGNQLQADGITGGQVVVGRSLAEAARLLRDGRIELYIDSVFPSLALSQLAGSKLLVRRWKKGVADYRAVIFARKDGGVSRLEDLKERTLAFEASYSSSGYLYPKMILLQKGFKLAPLADPASVVGRGKVGYAFTGDDQNTMLWVLKGKVSAGALDDQSFVKESGAELDKLLVVYRSFSIPRHIVSHRGDLSPRLVARIKEILLKMDQSEEGKKALHEFETTTKFDEIPSSAITSIRQGWKLVEAEIVK